MLLNTTDTSIDWQPVLWAALKTISSWALVNWAFPDRVPRCEPGLPAAQPVPVWEHSILIFICPSCHGLSWKKVCLCPLWRSWRKMPLLCWSVLPESPVGSQLEGDWFSVASLSRTWHPATAPGSRRSAGPSVRRFPLTLSPPPLVCSEARPDLLANTYSILAPPSAHWKV